MLLDGARRQEHPLRDLAVAQALRDQPEDIGLAFGHAQRPQPAGQFPVTGAVPRHRRPGPAQQPAAGGRHPLVAARGEVGRGLAQPPDRVTPAVGERRLGGDPAGVLPVPGHQRSHLRVRGGERRVGATGSPRRPARTASA